MGRRILVSLLSAIAVTLPQWSFALGLGEITLKSSLNQPLNAEIQLLEVRDLTENEILVGLASPEDFQRVGVDRPYFLTDIRFKVVLKSPSGPIIRISSRKVVREPFLNFVLQAQWPSGRLLREYTLLMDLPVFSSEQSQPVAAAQTQPIVEQTPSPSTSAPRKDSHYNPRSSYDQAPPRPQPSESKTPTSYTSNSQYTSQDTYTVRANDTLWEIAKQVRPDTGVSIQQTMLAMQRLNPEAFIKNNINLLKKGQILRIPDRTEIVSYNKRQAVNEVAAQNMRWSGDPNGGFASSGGAQLEGSRSYESTASRSDSAEGRVKLSSPEDYSGASEGRASGAGESSLDSLENELAITLEQLDKTERENSDLRSRISSLEEQISTMERMIDITNEEMRALELSAEKNSQEQASASDEAASQTVGDETSGDAEGTEQALADSGLATTESETESGLSGMEAETADAANLAGTTDESLVEATPEPTPEPTVAPTIAPNKVVIPAAPPQKTIVDHILDNIIFIGLGLVAILAGVFAFLKFRSSESEESEFDDDFLEQPMFEETPVEPEAEEIGEELDLGDFEEEPAQATEELPVEAEEPEPVAEPQTEDVVAEADIYIAYGKYDQAEEMLTKAIAKDPNDPRIRTKLLEVYSTQQDIERFDPQYAALLALGDAEANERAANLRDAISDAEPFDATEYDAGTTASYSSHLSGASDGLDDNLEDLDLQLDGESESDFDELSLDLEGDSGEVDVSDDEFTLDLGDDSEESDSDFDLSLDLGGDDSDEDDDDLSIDFESAEAENNDDALEDEFTLDLGDSEGSDSLGADEFDLSLDDEEDNGAQESGLDAEEFDLGDLSLDDEEDNEELDIASLAETASDSSSEPLSLEDESSDDDEFDLDLDSLNEDAIGSGGTGKYDLSDLGDVDVDINSSIESSNEPDNSVDVDFDDLNLDADEELLADDEAPLSVTQEMAAASESDDLELSDDLDLSALDQELDALTSDLSVEGADIADIEMTDAPQEKEPSLAQPTVMEEPVTDFDDLESELGLDADTVGEDLEAGLDLGDEQDDSVGDSGEDLFDEALANVPESDLDFEIPDVDPEGDDDLGFLSDSDETATKLDLARAYIDMGDAEGAKDILDEIMKEGNSQQKQEAENLLAKV